MSEYKLSVIVPTYNLEPIINKTFDSLRKQTIGFENIEVIFVDDRSSDKTRKKLSKFAREYENVQYFTLEHNSGTGGRPRNIGLRYSTADYVLFLDGDDQLLVDSCATLYNSIEKSKSDIVIGGHINLYSDGRLQHIPPLYFGRNEIFKDVINTNLFKIQPAIGAKLFRKELLEKNNIRFPEKIAGQDLVFYLNCLMESGQISVLNNFYVYYRTIRDDSITFNQDEKYFYGLIEAYCLVCDLFEKHDIDHDLQEMLLSEHLTFFTKQINRVHSSEKLEKKTIHNILSSKQFKTLSNKEIFKDNPIFKEYFVNMSSGQYDNQKLLKKISDNLSLEIKNEYVFLKEHNSKITAEKEELDEKLRQLSELAIKFKNDFDDLKTMQGNLIAENNKLNEENEKISKENEKLSEELNEIKSSILWKIKNKF